MGSRDEENRMGHLSIAKSYEWWLEKGDLKRFLSSGRGWHLLEVISG